MINWSKISFKFFHKLSSIIVGLFSYLLTLDLIRSIEDIHDVRYWLRSRGCDDGGFGLLHNLLWNPLTLEFSFQMMASACIWSPMSFSKHISLMRPRTSNISLRYVLSRWLALALLLQSAYSFFQVQSS